MVKPIEVVEFDEEKLVEIFHENSPASKEMILGKNHPDYFNKYLKSKDLGVKTIVVEHDYIDRDFLEDFSGYYVRCFSDYKRKCTRLHFFSGKFQQADFDLFLERFDPGFKDKLDKSYIGFIVIKPLPQTIIGRTCLKTYMTRGEGEDKRLFPTLRKYEVNLCGIDLSVESLAFQEQDEVVSACATSALWVVFQRTGILFHHKILSPVEITKVASKQFPITQRTFPNKGLHIEQMIHAVKELDMEPYVVRVENDDYMLKYLIYSYLTYGIPIILGIDLYDTGNESGYKYIGSHAVAITGYRLQRKPEESSPVPRPRLVACKMTRIYVHDDQIGPFAKMKLDGEKISIDIGENKTIEKITLKTEWKIDRSHPRHILAVPDIIIIPLYHKIRIPVEKIVEIVEILNAILDEFIRNDGYEKIQFEKFEWEISLTGVNRLKKEILSKSGKKGNFKEILQKKMPRFIWRAMALYKREPVVDLLFDATDIEQGPLFFDGIVYDQDLFSQIREIIVVAEDANDYLKKQTTGKLILEWLDSSYSNNLDRKVPGEN
jgi:hypothetical protein